MVRRVLEQGFALTEAAEAAGMSARTARKWVRQYRAEGGGGAARSQLRSQARPQLDAAERVEAITALGRLRMTGPEIAELLEMATSTVSAVLKRVGPGKRPPVATRPAQPLPSARGLVGWISTSRSWAGSAAVPGTE